MKIKHRGDTLIEVLIAFAILSLVISTAFSGSMSAYKSSLVAQNQTQANFVAQYQAEALKTYRDALLWNDPQYPSFLTGFSQAGSNTLPSLMTYIDSSNKAFCMYLNNPNLGKTTTDEIYWQVQTDPTACNNSMALLAPELGSDATVSITLAKVNNDINQIKATITVSWTPRNTSSPQSVVNNVLLTNL